MCDDPHHPRIGLMRNEMRHVGRGNTGFVERNFGGGHARNTGIDLSLGDFICFLDSDDLWLPDKLRQVERFIVSDPRSGETVFFHDLLVRRSGREDSPMPNFPLDDTERVLDYIFLKNGVIQTSALIVPAQAAKRVRFDDALRLHQDWDFSHRLQLAGLHFRRIPSALAIWSHDEGQKRVSGARNSDRSMAWISKLGDTVSREAMTAIEYRVLAPRVRAKHPFQALNYIWNARRAGNIGTRRFIGDTIILVLALAKGLLRRVLGWE